MPDNVKLGVADNLSQENYNLGSPDFYSGYDSRLAHTGYEINTIMLVKDDVHAKSTL